MTATALDPRTSKFVNEHSTIWPNWLTDWVFIYKVNPFGFESSCSHLNFRFRACFEQGVPWHSGNYKVWIHSETRTWHDKNIQSGRGMPNICLLLRKTDVLKSCRKSKFLGKKNWRNAQALKSTNIQGIFGETFILALLSSAVFRLRNCVSDFFYSALIQRWYMLK